MPNNANPTLAQALLTLSPFDPITLKPQKTTPSALSLRSPFVSEAPRKHLGGAYEIIFYKYLKTNVLFLRFLRKFSSALGEEGFRNGCGRLGNWQMPYPS